jgi:hypothetical protein
VEQVENLSLELRSLGAKIFLNPDRKSEHRSLIGFLQENNVSLLLNQEKLIPEVIDTASKQFKD